VGTPEPVRVAIVNDYEVVVLGLARMLAPFSDRVVVVELAAGKAVREPVDIALYDTFGQAQGTSVEVAKVLEHANAKHLVIYSWHADPGLVEESLRSGADGYVAKGLPAEELVSALEEIRDGNKSVTTAEAPPDVDQGDWPGRSHGLSEREAEVIALITQGLSNQEIADRAYLSINTVKTYVRSAYRKMGVTSRSQAVLWGIDHDFRPDHVRIRHPNDEL
jgi:two-component system, NarL family, response regulator LiaR